MLGFLRHPNLQFAWFVGWGDEGTPTQPTFEYSKQKALRARTGS